MRKFQNNGADSCGIIDHRVPGCLAICLQGLKAESQPRFMAGDRNIINL